MEHTREENIAELAKQYDLIFAANVNIARQSLAMIDGLKLIQRRILYIMFLRNGAKEFHKVETIAGAVLGQAHPHSSDAIKDALVNMGQWWKNEIPLIEIFGNAGTVAGDPAGAGRYISAKLSDYAVACFFEDWKDSVVDMELSFDEETLLPQYLPAKYPNVLLNGCLGIGHMGQAFNCPSFCFREVIEATIRLINDPSASIILIPDSPSGADIIQTNFQKLCEVGSGGYMQRCKYEIDAEHNIITITALPTQITANYVREKIAEMKENGGLPELVNMHDLSGEKIHIELGVRNDVNPYKFMKKMIKVIPGLEKVYPVNFTVIKDLKAVDYSVKGLLLDWIDWRREQKRVVISNKRTNLLAEQRINDVKLFIMNPENLSKTSGIYRSGKNRSDIESRLIAEYRDTKIRMDSLQARALSNMRMVELCEESYQNCVKRAEELEKELGRIEEIMNQPNGVDKIIIAELKDGLKRFGTPRKSNVIPYNISIENDSDSMCILQLSSDGMILRKTASNAEEEPVPNDSNGFACLVENDASFIIVNEFGMHTFIKVRELPLDTEVPVWRYAKKALEGQIVGLLPVEIDSDRCAVLVSKKGVVKRVRIVDIGPSKKPIISMDKDDRLIKVLVVKNHSVKDLLIYTEHGMGQRLSPNSIRVTSPSAKGVPGFKLDDGDKIVGVYAINPTQNSYLLYVTSKGRMRLNLIDYLPTRTSKHDQMVSLISLNNRDSLVSVVGCNRFDKAVCYYDDGTTEEVEIKNLPESTMAEWARKVTQKNAVSTNIMKVKII